MEKLFREIQVKHFSIGAHQSGMAQRSMELALVGYMWELVGGRGVNV